MVGLSEGRAGCNVRSLLYVFILTCFFWAQAASAAETPRLKDKQDAEAALLLVYQQYLILTTCFDLQSKLVAESPLQTKHQYVINIMKSVEAVARKAELDPEGNWTRALEATKDIMFGMADWFNLSAVGTLNVDGRCRSAPKRFLLAVDSFQSTLSSMGIRDQVLNLEAYRKDF
jgi:hypothetical protein